MQMTVKEIADFLKGELIGDGDATIKGLAGIKEAGKGELTFLANPRYNQLLAQTRASAVITSKDIKEARLPLICVDNPSVAFTKIVSKFHASKQVHPKGIHPAAIIAANAKLGNNVSLGAYVVVEENALIGDNSVIYPGCFIGRNVRIGRDVLIYANVSIREEVIIGERVVIQSGSVIGSDGFGFITEGSRHQRIPQIGTVLIEDDVEIGANVTIDRARFDKTIIGKGTKIDNLVHIAHNVIIGENCFIIAQVGISGSSVIGNNVTIAGQAGLAGHLSIGDNSIVAGRAGVTKSVPQNTVVSGFPARTHSIAKRIHACIQNLPRLYKKVEEIKDKIEELGKNK
ncbi:MAG: UDP-3-O-(3-hydroxymyristoyl)glucosamine N-acyltransferase [Candidatus Omnitrophica bacterium]|nr:UDP-3-O-(3-hydroxymyristoyl)glucosamine N-acyltransferase [Candidatus Omnitrophota bacterium]